MPKSSEGTAGRAPMKAIDGHHLHPETATEVFLHLDFLIMRLDQLMRMLIEYHGKPDTTLVENGHLGEDFEEAFKMAALLDPTDGFQLSESRNRQMWEAMTRSYSYSREEVVELAESEHQGALQDEELLRQEATDCGLTESEIEERYGEAQAHKEHARRMVESFDEGTFNTTTLAAAKKYLKTEVDYHVREIRLALPPLDGLQMLDERRDLLPHGESLEAQNQDYIGVRENLEVLYKRVLYRCA